jgi:hypothetical protein
MTGKQVKSGTIDVKALRRTLRGGGTPAYSRWRPRFFQLGILVAVILLVASPGVEVGNVQAAEIGCGQPLNEPIPDELARQLWPLGFRPIAGMCQSAYLLGKIEKGDYDKFRIFYRKNHPVLNVLKLLSPGGNTDEAMMIGRLLRKYLITAWGPIQLGTVRLWYQGSESSPSCRGPECVCASACALIWFGGVQRLGFVGLHRPRIEDPAFKALSPADATKAYKRALDDIAHYLDEMETPRPMIDTMVATSSSEIRWVDSDTDGVTRPPSYAEWLDASCGHVTTQEDETYLSLGTKEEGQRTANETLLYNMLGEQRFSINKCQMKLRFSHVEQLTPP